MSMQDVDELSKPEYQDMSTNAVEMPLKISESYFMGISIVIWEIFGFFFFSFFELFDWQEFSLLNCSKNKTMMDTWSYLTSGNLSRQ